MKWTRQESWILNYKIVKLLVRQIDRFNWVLKFLNTNSWLALSIMLKISITLQIEKKLQIIQQQSFLLFSHVHVGIFISIESVLRSIFLLLYVDIFIALIDSNIFWLFGKSLVCYIKMTVKSSNCSIGSGQSFSLLDVTGKKVRLCSLTRNEHAFIKMLVSLWETEEIGIT